MGALFFSKQLICYKQLFFVILSIILSVIGYGCSHKSQEIPQCQIIVDSPGPNIKIGELVEISAVQLTQEKLVVWNSADYDRNAMVRREGSVFKGDLFQALGQMSEGDSALVRVSIDSMIKYMGVVRPALSKGEYFTYQIRVHHVVQRGILNEGAYRKKTENFLQERLRSLQESEKGKIERYITSKGLKVNRSGSGLFYQAFKRGNGAVAARGDTVEVSYHGSLMSGKGFDSAGTDHPRRFPVGLGKVVKGLDEAFFMFPAGTQFQLIIPSALAFSSSGYPGIQPFTPLVYQMEIKAVRKLRGKHPDQIGAMLPDFGLTDIWTENLVQKEDLKKGKTVFVLSDSECLHCQQEVAAISARQKDFGNTNIYFVFQQESAQVKAFMKVYGNALIGKSNVFTLSDPRHELSDALQVVQYPSVYIYDNNHKLAGFLSGKTEIDQIITVLGHRKKT